MIKNLLAVFLTPEGQALSQKIERLEAEDNIAFELPQLTEKHFEVIRTYIDLKEVEGFFSIYNPILKKSIIKLEMKSGRDYDVVADIEDIKDDIIMAKLQVNMVLFNN